MATYITSGIYYPKTVFITGGCGFIGSHFIKLLLSLEKPPRIINFDALTYAGNLLNLDEWLNHPNHIFVKGDIRDFTQVSQIFDKYSPDTIINFAAESHVDRSIENPTDFFETNVGGTLVLLRSALKYGIKRYIQISTDEVYGSLGSEGYFTENTPLNPNSPYSASKASADHFVQAYHHTHNLDTIITRCSNNYGPYQFPEKLIPLMINNAIHNRSLPVYGDGLNVRDWIHVNDHCTGIWSATINGKSGQVYNFGGNSELTNIELVNKIINILDKSESLITFIKDRPGHDFRYAIDYSKSQKELGWDPSINFDIGLKTTIEWYLQNSSWLDSVTSGDYKFYYEKHYGIV
jgi:dTDP-glucose 4,6-dehydratase